MKQTIDMNRMRYLNLLEKISKVRSSSCFFYNNCLIFAVPKKMVSKAIGEGGKNIKKLSSILGKRVKIVGFQKSNSKNSEKEKIEKFISELVKPVTFKDIKIEDDKILISGTRQNKASLIGRGRIREKELGKITLEFFDKKVEII